VAKKQKFSLNSKSIQKNLFLKVDDKYVTKFWNKLDISLTLLIFASLESFYFLFNNTIIQPQFISISGELAAIAQPMLVDAFHII